MGIFRFSNCKSREKYRLRTLNDLDLSANKLMKAVTYILDDSRLLQFNQSKSARNVNFIMFLALFTCFYIVYMDVYML